MTASWKKRYSLLGGVAPIFTFRNNDTPHLRRNYRGLTRWQTIISSQYMPQKPYQVISFRSTSSKKIKKTNAVEVNLKKTFIYIVFQLSIASGYHFGKWNGLNTAGTLKFWVYRGRVIECLW